MKSVDVGKQLVADERERETPNNIEQWHEKLYQNEMGWRTKDTAISTMELRDKQCFGLMGTTTTTATSAAGAVQDAMPIEYVRPICDPSNHAAPLMHSGTGFAGVAATTTQQPSSTTHTERHGPAWAVPMLTSRIG